MLGLVVSLALSAHAVPPKGEPFSLAQATAGLPEGGELYAKLETGLGRIVIRLLSEQAPNTVANFVGLARGLRKFKDQKTGEWVTRPFYDGLTFHRRMPKFMIQGGCPRGDGRGGPGYVIDGELSVELGHDKPGVVSMVGAAEGTSGSQFFITELPAPHLDRVHAIFGEVTSGLEVVHAIARSAKPVVIERVTVVRHEQKEKQ
jgi:peptidyl-prolyl cis-trans isomerase A (cyclophilin A)